MINKASNKNKMIFTMLNNIFAKVYSTMICEIYTLLYSIKHDTKFMNVFGYK